MMLHRSFMGLGTTFINGPSPAPPTIAPQGLPNLDNGQLDPNVLMSQARQNLIAAGYAGAECHTETVGFPGGSYKQNVCSAPGYTGGTEANLILAMTPQQLAAQRAYEQAQGEGTSATPDYFQMTAGAPNIAVSNPTGGSTPNNPNTTSTLAPDWLTQLFSTQEAQAKSLAAQEQAQQKAAQVPTNITITTTTPSGGSSLLSGIDTTTSSIIKGIPDVFVYAGGALAALLLVMHMGSKR